MISGSDLKPGKVAVDFVRSQGGPAQATVVATDLRTSAMLAALANAMTAHADETDDAHFPTVTHPGSVILPASLGIAEMRHRSGRELINAGVLGYDVMCRINKAFDRAWMGKRGLHAGSLCAIFGAAAVTLLTEVLRNVLPQLLRGASGQQEIIAFGLILMIVMITLPEGLTTGTLIRIRRWRGERAQIRQLEKSIEIMGAEPND